MRQAVSGISPLRPFNAQQDQDRRQVAAIDPAIRRRPRLGLGMIGHSVACRLDHGYVVGPVPGSEADGSGPQRLHFPVQHGLLDPAVDHRTDQFTGQPAIGHGKPVCCDLPEADPASSSEAVGQDTRPAFEYLSTDGETFARYADARANRRDPFFIVPAGGADICNIPVPVRRVGG